MADSDARAVLVVSREPPYSSGLARAALDTLLATAAFDQPVSLLCLGEGVLQLLPAQEAALIGTRNHRQVLDSLALYGVETIFVDAAALARHGLRQDGLPPGCELLDTDGIRQLMARHAHILSF